MKSKPSVWVKSLPSPFGEGEPNPQDLVDEEFRRGFI